MVSVCLSRLFPRKPEVSFATENLSSCLLRGSSPADGRFFLYEASTTRTHGAPHLGQHPYSLDPALMHGSTSAGGNVAKWLDFSVTSW